MTSKMTPKITRRQVDNLRGESMRQASYLMSRLRMSILGKPAMEKCKCGEEYELFPNQPTKLDTAQVNAIKFDVDKIYPDIAEEELDKVTDEIQSMDEIEQDYADAVMKEGNACVIKRFAKNQREAALRVRELLDKYLADNVMLISTGNKEARENTERKLH